MNTMPVRPVIHSLAACALLCPIGAHCQVQSFDPALTFPSRAVRLIVTFPPGSATDIRSRQIAQKLSATWRQPVVVDNRPGAAGVIAMEAAARAAADGYTIVMGSVITLAIAPNLMKVPFDPIGDFEPVTKVSAGPAILVVNPSMPFTSINELVAYARAHPGKLNAGSAGTGSTQHMALELLNRAANMRVTHVPYKGGSPLINDLIAGQLALCFDFAPVLAPHIQSGRLRALAVASDRRLAVLPEIPTFGEAGIPGMEVTGWQGILVPAGTPRELITRLNADIVRVLNQPEVREAIINSGGEVGGDTPEAFRKFIHAEHARWGSVIREANIRVE